MSGITNSEVIRTILWNDSRLGSLTEVKPVDRKHRVRHRRALAADVFRLVEQIRQLHRAPRQLTVAVGTLKFAAAGRGGPTPARWLASGSRLGMAPSSQSPA